MAATATSMEDIEAAKMLMCLGGSCGSAVPLQCKVLAVVPPCGSENLLLMDPSSLSLLQDVTSACFRPSFFDALTMQPPIRYTVSDAAPQPEVVLHGNNCRQPEFAGNILAKKPRSDAQKASLEISRRVKVAFGSNKLSVPDTVRLAMHAVFRDHVAGNLPEDACILPTTVLRITGVEDAMRLQLVNHFIFWSVADGHMTAAEGLRAHEEARLMVTKTKKYTDCKHINKTFTTYMGRAGISAKVKGGQVPLLLQQHWHLHVGKLYAKDVRSGAGLCVKRRPMVGNQDRIVQDADLEMLARNVPEEIREIIA